MAYIFAQFQVCLTGSAHSSNESRTIPTYLALFIFGFIYELGLVWDALRLKNTIQVIGLCIYNVGLLVYAAVQYDQVADATHTLLAQSPPEIKTRFWPDVKPFLIAVPCAIALVALIMSLIAWKLYDEFAWTIYKHISADLRMKRRYLTYQIYIALLKFDFFFFLAFTVQFIVVIREGTTDAEFYLTIVAIPVTILILIMAGYFTRRESVMGMIVIIVLYFAAMAYFLFKLVRMYDLDNMRRVDEYKPARTSLTTFAIITICCLIGTIVNAIMCTRNFGMGLKPHIQSKKLMQPDDKMYNHNRPRGESAAGSAHPLGQVTARMTID